jgi:hypothetical protein
MNFQRYAVLSLLPVLGCMDGMPAETPGDAGYGVAHPALTTAEYPLATWITSPNFNTMSRKPPDVQVIVIHTTQGTYLSAINWFEATASQVSAHYVISKTGEITQMVLEKDKAWHVGSANGYTIGIEHEGMIDDPAWVTEPMLDASAQLCCYLLKKWQLPATKEHIKGHVELPNQTHTDPGKYWPWDTYLTKVQACMNPVIPDCGSCDDKNACTQDTCAAGTCQHALVKGACDDGDPCTVGDYCAQGLCLSGATTGCGEDATGEADVAAGPDVPAEADAAVTPDVAAEPDVATVPDVAVAADTGAEVLAEDIAVATQVSSVPQSAASGCQSTRAPAPAAFGVAALACVAFLRARRRA